MDGMMSAPRLRWVVLFVCGLTAMTVGSFFWQGCSSQPAAVTAPSQADLRLPTSPVSRPAPPPEGYVGSAACAQCHEDLCKSFAQHPMGRSSALTPGEADLEDYSAEKATFTAADGTRYKAEKVGDKVLHHEMGTDPQGRVLYDLMVPVSVSLGSGTRGKSYVVNREGILLQSPISWYSSKGGFFELSPGYERAASNQHFSRRVFEECLICHVGRMEFDREVRGKLRPPYFHEISIGCERCHGPGEKHVLAQQAGKSLSPDSTIINPARLSMRERESVCYQCHLHGIHRVVRYGRHPRDYRPGMPLEEVFSVLVKEASSSGVSKSVSQVEQMRESACFQGNPEKLGCISCHNPHEWPNPEKRDEYYRSRCNECHADKGCSLPAAKRAEKADSCIACHMPQGTPKDVVHASQTDHRVLRNPKMEADQEPSLTAEGAHHAPKFFDDCDQRIPYWEVQRARGIFHTGRKTSDNPQEDAVSLLLPLTAVAPDDVPLLLALGSSYLQRGDTVQGRKWLEKAVAIEPKNEHALTLLAMACLDLRDLSAAKKHVGEIVKLNPYVARSFALQAQILMESGERDFALQAAEKVIELDPTQASLRDRLLKAMSP